MYSHAYEAFIHIHRDSDIWMQSTVVVTGKHWVHWSYFSVSSCIKFALKILPSVMSIPVSCVIWPLGFINGLNEKTGMITIHINVLNLQCLPNAIFD